MAAPLLEVRDLRKRYGTQVALDGVSFTVQAGEMFGLLGPNGAGKTTLMSILAGLREPTAGEVRLNGERLTRGRTDLRHLIGIVPQDLAIYGELTARENLRFFGQLYGLAGHALEQRVETVLAAVALADRADARAGPFSGGMKRRLNLGAALVHGPSLLLLDEPTTGVDPQSRNHIFEEVRRLNSAGLTILYTSHYMEEVQALCPRIGIIDHGRLIACDTLTTLLRQLPGVLRLYVAAMPEAVRRRLEALSGLRPVRDDGRLIELECVDVKQMLVEVMPLLAEQGVALTGIETEEPNLERVFLHLTGRALNVNSNAITARC
jgi:ABC-2 type transport system ATP-binding protein